MMTREVAEKRQHKRGERKHINMRDDIER